MITKERMTKKIRKEMINKSYKLWYIWLELRDKILSNEKYNND